MMQKVFVIMYKNRLIYGIITARAGSKSIPNKNIKKIKGKPLIYYSIITSLKSKLIDRTILSTDSKKIQKIGKKYKCEAPFLRPKKIADDISTDFEVFRHLNKWLRKNDKVPHYYVHLRPTHPIRNHKLIDSAIKKIIINEKYDSLRSFSLSKETPFKTWMFKGKKIVPIINLKGKKVSHSIPRQILPKTYWQNGYVDVIKEKTISKKKSISGKNVLPFIIKKNSFDIDYIEELNFLKKNFNKIRNLKSKNIRYPS